MAEIQIGITTTVLPPFNIGTVTTRNGKIRSVYNSTAKPIEQGREVFINSTSDCRRWHLLEARVLSLTMYKILS